ncbi:MAG: MBL fold metallo-hydrolase [Candidatus Thorarchaeota archaeon]|jgi:glyoxylase-like metal-dependent hydrolase (beta-lactamase superfamily II)
MIEIVPFDENITSVKTATEYNGEAILWMYTYNVNNVLFDAGCANAKAELEDYKSKTKIEFVYTTHPHEDHVGGLSVFVPEATIFAQPTSIDLLRKPPELSEFFAFAWGQPEPVKSVELMPSEFDVGDFHFKVIPVPGHYHDMVGFYEPDKKWFFSADAIPLPSRKYIAMPDENVPQMIATMEKILELDICVLFDAHKGPVESPQEHIKIRIEYLKNTEKEIKTLHQEGKTVLEIVESLEFRRPWYLDLTKDRFGVDFFVESLLKDSVSS